MWFPQQTLSLAEGTANSSPGNLQRSRTTDLPSWGYRLEELINSIVVIVSVLGQNTANPRHVPGLQLMTSRNELRGKSTGNFKNPCFFLNTAPNVRVSYKFSHPILAKIVTLMPSRAWQSKGSLSSFLATKGARGESKWGCLETRMIHQGSSRLVIPRLS